MEDVSNSTSLIILQGWIASPQLRGTFDILSSCLIAILASTWTILHLNVPGARDSDTIKFFRKLKWMCFTIIFPEFMFAHAMEERLMAYMVLERLHNIGVKSIPLGHKKFAIASLVGNLEWREIPSVLAQILPCFHPIRSVREDSDNDTASWMNRLLRFRSHAQGASSPVAKYTLKKTDFSRGTIAIAGPQTPLDQDIEMPAESQRPVTIQNTSEENRTQAPSSHQTHEWTTIHAIFANMGGFRLAAETKDRTMQYRTINGFQLTSLVKTGTLSQIPNISKQEILDKSKTDAFARWVAILQCLWLLLELTARKVESLPSSQIEIATMAFACCSILTYLAVRHKPKDVDVALDIPSTIPVMEGIPSSPDPLFDRPVSFFLEVFCYKPWYPGGYFGLIPAPGGAPGRRRPIRWGEQDADRRIRNDNYLVRNYRSHPMSGWLVIGSTVFGGIHCVAWDHYFASSLERKLWRAAALVTTLAPLLLPIIDRGANSFQRQLNLSRSSTGALWFMKLWTIVLPLAVLVAYLLLRICIIVLVFSSLRAMPEGVYHTTWTKYLLSVH